MSQSLVCPETVSRVSSVLNRNSREFGKKYLFDEDEETCWNSDQGPSQWVTLEFPHRVHITQLQVQFQGGFSSRHSCLEGSQGGDTLSKIVDFYPEDTNALQISCLVWGLLKALGHTFSIPTVEVDRLKLTFEDTTDFFGRVVIYHLRVLGLRLAAFGMEEPEMLLKGKKVTDKFTESVYVLANEPSVALYRLQEHVRRSLPELAQHKADMQRWEEQSQGAIYTVEYACSAVKSLVDSGVYFRSVEGLLRQAISIRDHMNTSAQGHSQEKPSPPTVA